MSEMDELLNSYLLQFGEEESIVEFADSAKLTDNLGIFGGDSNPSANGELPIILLDLETSGFSRDCEILQIAAKCRGINDKVFETYVLPKKPISGFASEANGLTCHNGVLKYHGKPVQTVSLMTAMKNLLSWLTSFNKQCYVATHNLSFDGPRLYDAIISCDLRNDFSEVIYGFIDTLRVIREVTGRRNKGQCTIGGLAKWLDIPSDGAHNALCDVEILDKILQKAEIGYGGLIENAETYSNRFHKWDNDKYVKGVLRSLDPLKGVVGEPIRKKMVKASITIEDLKNVYANYGQRGLTELLSRKVDGKPIVTNRTDTILKIVNWIRLSSNTLFL